MDKTWNAEPEGGPQPPLGPRVPDQAEFTKSVATLADLFRAVRTGNFSLSGTELALLIGAAVYIISPIDLVPEAILGPIGLLDDLGALLAAFGVVQAALTRFRRR